MLTYIANVLRIRAMNVPRGIFGGHAPPVAEPDGYEPQDAPVHPYAFRGPPLSAAGEDYEPQVVLLDSYAAHMDPAVAELLESRGYVLLLHGGGTTDYVRASDFRHGFRPSRPLGLCMDGPGSDAGRLSL